MKHLIFTLLLAFNLFAHAQIGSSSGYTGVGGANEVVAGPCTTGAAVVGAAKTCYDPATRSTTHFAVAGAWQATPAPAPATPFNLAGTATDTGADKLNAIARTGAVLLGGTGTPASRLHVLGTQTTETVGCANWSSCTSVFKPQGQTTLQYGSYSGAWQPSIQIQGTAANSLLWLGNVSGSNATWLRAVPALDIRTGGTPNDSGVLAASFRPSGQLQLATYTTATTFTGTAVAALAVDTVGNVIQTPLNATTAPAWLALPLQGGWANYGNGYMPAQYRKVGDVVELRGLVQGGGYTIATLPAGYRPTAGRGLFAVQTNANTIGRIDIDTAGSIMMVQGNNGWISLDNVRFSIN